MARLFIGLLGPLEITCQGRALDRFEYNKVRALLLYLALEGDRAHSRSNLAALLWPDMPERAARQNLSQALTTLRRALNAMPQASGTPFVLATPESVQLNPAADLEVDVKEFLCLLEECEAHAHRSWHICTTCAQRLSRAVALYRGDFLAQFFLHDSAPFEEWALLQRTHLRQRALSALERLAQWAEWREAYGQAADFLRRQIELEPLLESSHRELMRLLALSGQLTTAFAQYELLRRTLAQELGAEPEAETTTLHQRIRSAATGTENLRRFTPPAVTVPTPPALLIGRAAELQAVCEQLRDGGRVLTLVGPPGVGKTRLALEALRELHYDFSDGAQWVELAPISEPAMVPAAIAQVLGVKEQPGQKLEATLTAHLKPRHLLLALDNLEQLVAAAPFVAELVAACPALKVLATSRAPLRIRAEQQFPLSPLGLPQTDQDFDVIARAPAVQMFVDRAQAAYPSFTLEQHNAATVAAICARLDGLPLALELVAARVDKLPCDEILRQLEHRPAVEAGFASAPQPIAGLTTVAEGPRDLPERQQTLRQAIQWSFDLLDPESQQLFIQLGVFVGGATLEAAQAVCGNSANLELLTHLVDTSLISADQHHSETRYRMLEMIREFALEQLAPRGEVETVRRRHGAYFLALAERAAPELQGPEQQHWLDRLEREHDNLRAALAWTRSADDDAQLRLAVALGGFWDVRGHLAEGRRWLTESLERNTGAALPLRAVALDKAGALAYRQGDYRWARVSAEHSLETWRSLADGPEIVRALRRLGVLASEEGDLERARFYQEQSLDTAREIGYRQGELVALGTLGGLVALQGDYSLARRLQTESLRRFESLGDQAGIGYVLNALGWVEWWTDDDAEAQFTHERSLAVFQAIGHKWGIASAQYALGVVAHAQADYAAAQEHFQESLALYRQLGSRAHTCYPLSGLGEVAYARGDYAAARSLFHESLAQCSEAGEQRHLPSSLERVAKVNRTAGRPERAALLCGAAEALRECQSAKLSPRECSLLNREKSALLVALGETAFASAWAEGRALSKEQAVALALIQPLADSH